MHTPPLMARLSLKTHVAQILTKKLTSIPQSLFSPGDLAEIFTQILSGQLKSGQRWSLQKRPTDVARNLVLFSLVSPAQASPF